MVSPFKLRKTPTLGSMQFLHNWLTGGVSGHSLRAGLATTAAIGEASERAIMAQTGHKSVNMVRRYIRDGSLFRENAAAKVGL
jgi:integrase